MEEFKTILTDAVDTISHATPGAFTVLVVLAIGYALKMSKVFGKWIPLISFFVVGPICYYFTSSPGDMDPALTYPEVRQLFTGMVLAVFAWMIHRAVLKKYVDKWLFHDKNGGTGFKDKPKG